MISDLSLCRERGARALEERLAAEKLGAARNSEESQIDGADNVWFLRNSTLIDNYRCYAISGEVSLISLDIAWQFCYIFFSSVDYMILIVNKLLFQFSFHSFCCALCTIIHVCLLNHNEIYIEKWKENSRLYSSPCIRIEAKFNPKF